MFKPDNKPVWTSAQIAKKLSIMKKLKMTVMITVTSVFVLGSFVNIKEELRLTPENQLVVTNSISEKTSKNAPNNYRAYSTFVYLFYDSAATWTVPANWNNADNKIEVIGGGGSGSTTSQSKGEGAGGGGGGYAYVLNSTLTIGSAISYKAGNPVNGGNIGGNVGANGNPSFFSTIVRANGGTRGNNITGGAGGTVVTGTGFSGGNGGNGNSSTLARTSHGGGAAGPHGPGDSNGNGDAGFGGAVGTNRGDTGSTGFNLGDGQAGSGGGGQYGFGDGGLWGGGGGGGANTNGGAGREGLVVISYVPVVASTTTLTSSVNPSGFGQTTTFTATVTSGATGTVTFKDGATTIGTSTIVGNIATLDVSNLTVGSHSITAVYSGDNYYFSSTSSAVTQVVKYVGRPFRFFFS